MECAKIVPAVKSERIYEMARDFLRPHEKVSCQLSELLGKQNKNVFAVLSMCGESLSVRGIVYCSKGGTVLPFFKNTDESLKQPLIDFFTGRKIFCVSGESSSVDFLTGILLSLGNQGVMERRGFISMESVRPMDVPAKDGTGKIRSDIEGRIFVQCTRERSDELFSMQIEYIREEVLPDGMTLNLPVERLEMDRLLKNGKIYAIVSPGGKILCKAQVNGECGSCILIGGVYTDKLHRRKGFARMMMESLKSLAAQKEKSCVLFVNKLNAAAISLYEKTGFKKIGEHEIVYMSQASD